VHTQKIVHISTPAGGDPFEFYSGLWCEKTSVPRLLSNVNCLKMLSTTLTLHGTVVERQSLAGELFLFCARSAADE